MNGKFNAGVKIFNSADERIIFYKNDFASAVSKKYHSVAEILSL